jgi:hypothetical protein
VVQSAEGRVSGTFAVDGEPSGRVTGIVWVGTGSVKASTRPGQIGLLIGRKLVISSLFWTLDWIDGTAAEAKALSCEEIREMTLSSAVATDCGLVGSSGPGPSQGLSGAQLP